MPYKNQKTIKIQKISMHTLPKNIISAQHNLKDSAFRLYIYLITKSSNQTDVSFKLSRIEAMAQTGISESSYKKATKELHEKKYLIPDINKDHYLFTTDNQS